VESLETACHQSPLLWGKRVRVRGTNEIPRSLWFVLLILAFEKKIIVRPVRFSNMRRLRL
jgi:hypothetical protein